jgi:hypothetical protein
VFAWRLVRYFLRCQLMSSWLSNFSRAAVPDLAMEDAEPLAPGRTLSAVNDLSHRTVAWWE